MSGSDMIEALKDAPKWFYNILILCFVIIMSVGVIIGNIALKDYLAHNRESQQENTKILESINDKLAVIIARVDVNATKADNNTKVNDKQDEQIQSLWQALNARRQLK